MKDFEFFRNVSLGQYVDSGTPIHRLSPLTKYLGLFALVAPALAARPAWVILLVLGAALGLARLARVRGGFLLRGLKPALPALLLIAALQILIAWPGDSSLVLGRLGPLDLTLGELAAITRIAARLAALMTILGLFTAVTTTSQIVHGVEDALSPLERIGIPSHRLALVVGIAFRFIPILALEAELIVKAQASRGADFGSGTRNPIARVRAYLPILVPLMVRALERAELLVEAMEARAYSGGKRARLADYGNTPGERALRAALVLSAVAASALAAGAPTLFVS